MQTRKFDELISYFNRNVSNMDIDKKYKIELLGMITAIGFAHEKELHDPTIEPEPPWIPVSERLPEQGRPILFCDVDGDVFHGFYKHSQWNEFLASYPIVNVVAWMPQPKSYKGVKNA